MIYSEQILDTNYILNNLVMWEICSIKSFLVFPLKSIFNWFSSENLLVSYRQFALKLLEIWMDSLANRITQ